MHSNEYCGTFVALLLDVRNEIMEQHSIVASPAGLPGSAMSLCQKLLRDKAEPTYIGKGKSGNQKPDRRQAFRAWKHTTSGGDWCVEAILRHGGITEAFVRHLNDEVRQRVAMIVQNRIRRGLPANAGKVVISKLQF